VDAKTGRNTVGSAHRLVRRVLKGQKIKCRLEKTGAAL
jgi:hypothetical protein